MNGPDVTSEIPVLEPEVITQQLADVEQSTGIEQDSALALRGQFADYYNEIVNWRGRVSMITDVTDPVQQKAAREIRLGLKDVRCNVERLRKALKEDSLKRGKAIDGFANVLKYLCEPVEKKLLDVEQYAERMEAKRIETMVLARTMALKDADPEINTEAYNLVVMDQAAFDSLVEQTRKVAEAREEARKKEEADRIAKEKAEAEEQERVRKENEKLKKEAEAREAELEKERKAKAKAEAKAAEAKRKEEERIAKEKAEAEAKAKAEKAAKAKAARAPDREKIKAFVSSVLDLPLPKLASAEGKDLMIEISEKRDSFACWIEKKAEDL